MPHRLKITSLEVAEITGYAHDYLTSRLRKFRIKKKRKVVKDEYRRDRVIYILDRIGVHRLTLRMSKTKGDLLKDYYNLKIEEYHDKHQITDNSNFF